MSNERRLAVLRAIVEDYVATREPVGSKALLERHSLGVSAATVRNDMAALEDEGLLEAPHTSAGRIPTDAGYRVFVDRLSTVKPLSAAERRAIGTLLDGAVDLDDVIDRTVRLLASLTHQVAVVQYPSLTRSSVRHIEFVSLGPNRLLVVLITTTGRVEQRVIETADDLTAPDNDGLLAALRTTVNTATVGRTLADAAGALGDLPTRVDRKGRRLLASVAAELTEVLVEQREERVVLAGTSNLLRAGEDFAGSLGQVLEALEEHVVLLKLFHAGSEHADSVAVRIGAENPYAGLRSTSLVTTGYGAGEDLVAGLGVLGPTRMDYPSSMAAVRAVAAYLSRILAEN